MWSDWSRSDSTRRRASRVCGMVEGHLQRSSESQDITLVEKMQEKRTAVPCRAENTTVGQIRVSESIEDSSLIG